MTTVCIENVDICNANFFAIDLAACDIFDFLGQ